MAVITISRELGSEGDRIADLVCQELGYRRVDKALLSEVARQAGVDVEAILAMERSFATRARLVSSDMLSLYSKQPTAFDQKRALDDQTYIQIVRQTMEQYAREGHVVIVGRGGQMALRNWPNALHVHLYAAVEVRIRRLMQRHNITEQEARRRIAASDEEKRQAIRHMYGNAEWKDLRYYHLTINTGCVAPETAARIIVLAARERDEV
ncbi:MAG: AAA family ATPase [Anaerolineae bacterium]